MEKWIFYGLGVLTPFVVLAIVGVYWEIVDGPAARKKAANRKYHGLGQ